MKRCSLCRSKGVKLNLYLRGDRRDFWNCKTCGLIQTPEAFHLSLEEEKAHYDTHENNSLDGRYRSFLERLTNPLCEILKPSSSGLDFGSGPGPTLGILMQERGHKVENYDPFYAPDASLFSKKYDFITLTEVIEHLRNPAVELVRLWDCLKPGGHLAIMTQMTDGVEDFGNWYYQRDLTHICFWRQKTMNWLGKHLSDARLSFPEPNLAFLQKTSR